KDIAPGAVESFVFETIPSSPPAAGTYRFNAEVFPEDSVPNNSKISNVITVDPSQLPSDDKTGPILKLSYLGVGQRVGFPPTDLLNPPITSVVGALNAMSGKFVPLGKSGNSLVSHLTNVYDPNAGWLVGADFTLFNVLRLAFVFFE